MYMTSSHQGWIFIKCSAQWTDTSLSKPSSYTLKTKMTLLLCILKTMVGIHQPYVWTHGTLGKHSQFEATALCTVGRGRYKIKLLCKVCKISISNNSLYRSYVLMQLHVCSYYFIIRNSVCCMSIGNRLNLCGYTNDTDVWCAFRK